MVITMQYITGIHAMNLPCSLDTCGDWHRSALKWEKITFGDTEKSIFGDYGIEFNPDIPNVENGCYVANHIRAALDMLDNCDFTNLQGLRENYICNELYTQEIFDGTKKILDKSDRKKQLRISKFMEQEYNWAWYNYIKPHYSYLFHK